MNGFALLATSAALIALLAGCTNPIRPAREEWPQIGDEFSRALRWGDIKAASTYVADAEQTAFLDAFPDDGSLRIIDARHEPVGVVKDDQAQARLTLEYYRIPSVTIKKEMLPVVWNCTGGATLKPCSWRLTKAPERLP